MTNKNIKTTVLSESRAQTWWQYSANGEATQIGKAPGGAFIQFGWDALGLLKAVSDNGNSHEFTYNPSGLRVRDKRTASGAHVHDKRYVYTTGGALMSAYELNSSAQITSRRDVVYANGEAIAEIDASNNIYELHNNYLGTPRYITNGNTSQGNKGQVVGEQSFGPYGEQMVGTFSGKQLPTGYRPLTGYTGHLNEDLTGLIYMKGRYYSPLWHRFINSDQGVDPNSLNQFAYVNGRPFMAADPSGMRMCYYLEFTRELPTVDSPKGASVGVQIHTVLLYCDFDGPRGDDDSGGGGGDLWGGGGGDSSQGKSSQDEKTPKIDCERYADALVDRVRLSSRMLPLGKNLFGANLAYRANNRSLSSFGLSPYWSGFKEYLVNNEQKNGVYKHITAVIGGAMVMGGGIAKGIGVANAMSSIDAVQYVLERGRPESFTEMRGNIAGAMLVPGFDMYFSGFLGSESLKKYIMSALCNK